MAKGKRAKTDHDGGGQGDDAPPQVLADDDLCDYIPTPPDGGYGWVIMIASFFNNAILDGIAYCFGVFLEDYSSYFGSTRAQTSLLGSLLCGVYLLVGPIAGALVNKFGCRPVGIAGSLIGAAAFLVSIAVPNVQLMYLTYGVVGGFGFGLMYLPAVVGVGYYFDKKRALATGIAVCGTGIGTFALAPFSQWLLSEYDWKSAHIILAGIVLHGVVSSALMRPLQPKKRSRRNGSGKVIITGPPEPLAAAAAGTAAPRSMGSQVVAFSKTTSMGSQLLRVELPTASLAVPSTSGAGDQRMGSSYKLGSSSVQFGSRSGTLDVTDLSRPMYKKDIFYSGSVYNVATTDAPPLPSTKDDRKYIASVMSVPTVEQARERRSCFSCLPKAAADVLSEMMDVSLFKDKTVIILSLANFVGMLGFYIPYMYSTDRAVTFGVDKDRGALLISIIGITNTIGRVLFGAAATMPRVSALLLNNVCTLIAALAVTATPWCTTFEAMAVVSAAYGFFCSCLISFTTIIICDLLGLERMTNCFGIIAMVRGITACVGPPLAALLYDITQSYDLTFYIGGSCLIASALLHFLLHLKTFKSTLVESAQQQQPAPNSA